MFPVTITIHNAVQLNAVVNALDGLPVPKATSVVVLADDFKVTARGCTAAEAADDTGRDQPHDVPAKPKAKAAEPKKPTLEPEQPSTPSTGTTSESEQLDAQSDTGELAGGEKTYTLADAQDLTKKVVAAGKRAEMVALLAKYEAKVAAQLKPEQIQPFCVEAEGLLK